ncbi:MAG: AraC family transcriptional regulator [Clostridia bacterium]|nr:AraC family transcriptional regulator [Clostridia bacterium]
MSHNGIYRESVVHRSGSLPLRIYDSSYVGFHWHEEYEFLLAEQAVTYCTVNGRHTTLRPGEAMLIQSGGLHSLFTENATPLTAIVVHPSFWAGQEHANLFDGSISFPSYFSEQDALGKEVIALLRRIRDCYKAKEFGYEFRLKALFSTLFCLLLEHKAYEVTPSSVRKESPADKLFAYVHGHLQDDLSLDGIAGHLHYSKSYVIKLFKSNTGQTPTEYINRYRVERAKELLSSCDMSVLDISLACGYRNVGYFIRVFTRYTGVTPGKWRK